jgi:hypothetical protein
VESGQKTLAATKIWIASLAMTAAEALNRIRARRKIKGLGDIQAFQA